jgi:hypothetical protein
MDIYLLIERPMDNALDINVWDSHAVMFKWLASPVQ